MDIRTRRRLGGLRWLGGLHPSCVALVVLTVMVVLTACAAALPPVATPTANVSLGQAVSTQAPEAPWKPPLERPLDVSGPYRPPPTPYTAGHRGIDLPALPGDSVYAPTGGVVSFVGRVADRHVISIQVDSRTVVSLEPVVQNDDSLAEGDSLGRGQLIGEVSEGGHCFAECVHLGVRVDGAYVNPLRYFYGKPVLLPW